MTSTIASGSGIHHGGTGWENLHECASDARHRLQVKGTPAKFRLRARQGTCPNSRAGAALPEATGYRMMRMSPSALFMLSRLPPEYSLPLRCSSDTVPVMVRG